VKKINSIQTRQYTMRC